MASDRGNRSPGKGARRAFLLILSLAVLASGVVAVTRRWVWNSDRASQQLDPLHAAWNEFSAGRFDQALATLDRRASTVAPTAPEWLLRARIAESQGRLAEALDHLKHIGDTDPLGAQAWLKVGQIELVRHRAIAAEAALLHSVAINPDSLQSYRELAVLYTLQRRNADCDAQFRALSHRMPMGHVMAFMWCQNYCDIWDPDESGKILRQFVDEDPNDRWSRLALALSYRMKHRSDEAEATLAPLPDTDLDARAVRVQIAIDKGEIEAATKLARPGPTDHERLNVLYGEVALAAGEYRDAADYFRAALRQDPESRHAIHGLGVSLQRLKDPTAEKWFQIADRHDRLRRLIVESVTTIHTDPTLFSKLGVLCESLHRREGARVWYQVAIERDPLDVEAQQGLSRLRHAGVDQHSPSTAN